MKMRKKVKPVTAMMLSNVMVFMYGAGEVGGAPAGSSTTTIGATGSNNTRPLERLKMNSQRTRVRISGGKTSPLSVFSLKSKDTLIRL